MSGAPQNHEGEPISTSVGEAYPLEPNRLRASQMIAPHLRRKLSG